MKEHKGQKKLKKNKAIDPRPQYQEVNPHMIS